MLHEFSEDMCEPLLEDRLVTIFDTSSLRPPPQPNNTSKNSIFFKVGALLPHVYKMPDKH